MQFHLALNLSISTPNDFIEIFIVLVAIFKRLSKREYVDFPNHNYDSGSL